VLTDWRSLCIELKKKALANTKAISCGRSDYAELNTEKGAISMLRIAPYARHYQILSENPQFAQ